MFVTAPRNKASVYKCEPLLGYNRHENKSARNMRILCTRKVTRKEKVQIMRWQLHLSHHFAQDLFPPECHLQHIHSMNKYHLLGTAGVSLPLELPSLWTKASSENYVKSTGGKQPTNEDLKSLGGPWRTADYCLSHLCQNMYFWNSCCGTIGQAVSQEHQDTGSNPGSRVQRCWRSSSSVHHNCGLDLVLGPGTSICRQVAKKGKKKCVFIFICLFGCTCGMQKLNSQGSNRSHCNYHSHQSDNARIPPGNSKIWFFKSASSHISCKLDTQ